MRTKLRRAEAPPTPARLRKRGRTLRVVAIIATLLAVAVAVGRPVSTAGVLLPALTLPWWVIMLAFAATETFVLHIQIRRETQSISSSQSPRTRAFAWNATCPRRRCSCVGS